MNLPMSILFRSKLLGHVIQNPSHKVRDVCVDSRKYGIGIEALDSNWNERFFENEQLEIYFLVL